MSDIQKSGWSLPPDPDSDSELDIPTRPYVAASLRRNKISNQPHAILAALHDDRNKTGKSLGVQSFGYHPNMDAFLNKELKDAIATDVEGLTEKVFPSDAFAVAPDVVLDALKAGPTPMYANDRWDCPNLKKQHQERPFATFLDNLGDEIRAIYAEHEKPLPAEKRRWSADFCDTPLNGGVASRKPDLSLVPEGREADWTNHIADGQLKSNVRDKSDASAQLFDGALNTLSAQDERHHHIGVAFIGELCFISYCDRAGCIQSLPLDIHADPEGFLRIFMGLTIADRGRLGFDPTIIHDGGKRYVVIDGKKYELVKNLTQAAGIRGLGTVVWQGVEVKESEKDGGERGGGDGGDGEGGGGQGGGEGAKDDAKQERESVAIKSAWADRTRAHSEDFFLDRANKAGVEGVPTLVGYERVRHNGHLLSTETIREGLTYGKDCKVVFEVRDLTRLVVKEIGVPLHQFASKTEFLSAIRDIVYAHDGLYNKANTLHCDINDKNVLLRVIAGAAPETLRRGLLIDENYSTALDEKREGASSALRSCGPLFAASDILMWPDRFAPELRHDLESLLCLVIWTCVCFAGPSGRLRVSDMKESKIYGWLQMEESYAGANKAAVLNLRPKDKDMFRDFMKETFHPYWDDVQKCVYDLRRVIMRDDPPPTHMEVIKVLDKHIPRIKLREEKAPEAHHPATAAKKRGRIRGVGGASGSQADGAEEASELRKTGRKRARVSEGSNSPYFEEDCTPCGKKALKGERVVECRNPKCRVLYHERCAPLKEGQSYTTWLCWKCVDSGFKLPKKQKAKAPAPS
ncbi:uncharacterized protein SCHCODRAFT_02686200 [Schizophyllum commune H4-8]|nr:uncharacterized protein SCHCODRAFT_02686200 [Schizophyllum commune H4-8]KAI5894624.1 hypothetical protein SCHCODRAFT_02686200 [Schizophyllum commune H4-8]